MTIIQSILNTARWAPSSANSQPWRFEIQGERHLIVHGHDTRDRSVYDLDGRSSQMALGALLENIAIAAREWGFEAEIERRAELADTTPTFDVHLLDSAPAKPDSLYRFIPIRATQRRRISPRPLKPAEKQGLEDAAGAGFRVVWLNGWNSRVNVGNLLCRYGDMCQRIPEVYEFQKRIIEWDSSHSEDRVPDRAIGLDPVATRLLRWTLKSWARTRWLGIHLGGSMLPRFQLDWLPALWCGGHFLLVADRMPRGIDDYVAGGRAMQRVWLTATSLGLQAQPEMTPLIFARYIRERRRFSSVDQAQWQGERLAIEFAQLAGQSTLERTVFMARVGHGAVASARSTRLPVEKLMWPGD